MKPGLVGREEMEPTYVELSMVDVAAMKPGLVGREEHDRIGTPEVYDSTPQ